jgi:hypothetical protein
MVDHNNVSLVNIDSFNREVTMSITSFFYKVYFIFMKIKDNFFKDILKKEGEV